MRFVAAAKHLWETLRRGRQYEQDLNDELQSWIDELAARKVQAGLSDEAAREAALLELGEAAEHIKDRARRQRRRAAWKTVAYPAIALAMFTTGAATTAALVRWGDPLWVDTVFRPSRVAQPEVHAARSDERQRVVYLSNSGFPSEDVHSVAQPRAALEGEIRDEATGLPMPNVQISLRSESPLVTTRTDEHGRFRLLEPSPASVYLLLGRTNWEIPFENVVVTSTLRSVHFLRLEEDSGAPYSIIVTNKDGATGSTAFRIQFLGTGQNGKLDQRDFTGVDLDRHRLQITVPNVPALQFRRYMR